LAFGVVFEGVFELGVPFCVVFGIVFGVVFGVVLVCCACIRAPQTANPDAASRIKVPKIFCVIGFLLGRSEVP
jgi:Na+/H+ antiporter NhaA